MFDKDDNFCDFCDSQVVFLVAAPIVCASVISYVVFVLSLFVPYLSLFWCLGRVALRESGIS